MSIHVSDSRHPSVMVGRLLNPDRVLAIMLGVKDNAINLDHRTCKILEQTWFLGMEVTRMFSVLVSFSQWVHLEAKDHNLEFVQTVLYFSTQILQKSVNANSSGQQRLQKYCQPQKSFNGRLGKFILGKPIVLSIKISLFLQRVISFTSIHEELQKYVWNLYMFINKEEK